MKVNFPALVLVLALCAASSCDIFLPPPAATGGSSTTNADAGVSLQGFAFSPSSVTISKGATLKWTNLDTATHSVTSTGAQTFESGNLTKDGTFSVTFPDVGNFTYKCRFHSSMTASVTVN